MKLVIFFDGFLFTSFTQNLSTKAGKMAQEVRTIAALAKLKLRSQHLYSSSQLSITPAPEYLTPSLGSVGTKHTCGALIYIQSKHPDIE